MAPRPRLRFAASLVIALVAFGPSLRAGAGEARAAAAACFAPGTSPEVIEEIGRRLAAQPLSLAAPADGFQYSDGRRWRRTATDGDGLTEGDPTTLTWSYVPDGTPVCGFVGEPASPSNLQAWLDGLYGDSAAWHAVFQQVLDRWGALTGNRYVYEPNDDGAPLGCSTLPDGQLGVRGDLRIAAHLIDGSFGVLAYNFYPDAGEMVIDSYDAFFNDRGNGSLGLRNVLAHEHGHGLGFSHVCPVNRTKLMEPYVTTVFDGPQPDDILAGNRAYGDDREPDDAVPAAADLGPFGGGASLTLDDLSIDDDGDVDFFAFEVREPVRITARAIPQGSTYLSGAQNGNGSCSAGSSFNSLAVHDLALVLLDHDGQGVLAAADASGAGASETIADFALPTSATYYLRVSGSAANAAQLYALVLSADPAFAPAIALAQELSPGSSQHPVGSSLDYTLTASNAGNAAADGVVIRVCLDPRLDPAELTVLDGGVIDAPPAPAGCGSDWIAWTLAGPLDPAAPRQVGYRVSVPLLTPDGTLVSSAAEIGSNQTPFQPANPLAASICAPALALAMTSDHASCHEGDAVTWTLTVTNPHPSCALSAVELDDAVDLQLLEDEPALTWSVPPGATTARNGSLIQWWLPSLAPGASETIAVTSRIRAGAAGSTACNRAVGSFSESAVAVSSNAACAAVERPCPAAIAGVNGVVAVRGPATEDVTVSWAPVSLAEAYDLWRVTDERAAITGAGRGRGWPIQAVPGCADPTPAAGTSCIDAGALAAPGLFFYQVRGVCGGNEGGL